MKELRKQTNKQTNKKTKLIDTDSSMVITREEEEKEVGR